MPADPTLVSTFNQDTFSLLKLPAALMIEYPELGAAQTRADR
jgi:hypothetical protein